MTTSMPNPEVSPRRPRLAVVGGGVAGIVAAWKLRDRAEVTLFENQPRLGGHTHTVTIPDGPDAGIGVDTGFIVLNERTYPNLHDFLGELGDHFGCRRCRTHSGPGQAVDVARPDAEQPAVARAVVGEQAVEHGA